MRYLERDAEGSGLRDHGDLEEQGQVAHPNEEGGAYLDCWEPYS